MEPTLSKEEVLSIMKERGYEFIASISDDKILRFAKPNDLNLSLYAEVNMIRYDTMINVMELPVYLNSFWFDFLSPVFDKREKVILDAAKIIKDSMGLTPKKKEKGATVDERKAKFWEEIRGVAKIKGYPKEMCMAFYSYWTEMNTTGTKMRKEKEGTFETSLRLGTWARNDKTFGKSFATIREDEKAKKQNEQLRANNSLNPKDLF